MVADLLAWGQDIGRGTSLAGVRGGLPAALRWLETRNFQPDRAILVSLGDNWTAFFDNHSSEYEPQAEMFVLCERLRTATAHFYYNHDVNSQFFRSACYTYNWFDDVSNCVVERSVSAVVDENKWEFCERGSPLPFENVSAYSKRQKSDRLTSALMREYALALGIPFCEPRAYGDEVALLKWNSASKVPDVEIIRLAEACFGRAALVHLKRSE
ncbi:MAG: hypothetical protein SF069_04660 [Phycisphaerae bacterium]|nr:hypothetical protein [Phycisphaerae bacterium]